MIICAVYDKKSKLYEQPFFVANVAQATRGFAAEIQRGGTPFSMFADDFELHELGEFKNNEVKNAKTRPIKGSKVEEVLEIEIIEKAKFVTLTEPRILAVGSAFKKQAEEVKK